MTSTYAPNSGITLIGTGDQSGTWGDTTNTNLTVIDRLTNGVGAIALSGTTYTLTTADGTLNEGQYRVLVFGGSPSGTNTVTISPNNRQHLYVVKNNSGQSVIMTQGSGGNVTIANGASKIVYCDGAGSTAAIVDITSTFSMSNVTITGGSAVLTGGSAALTGASSVTTSSSSPAFTVTQTGSGASFLVEDSASTDSTPFIIDTSGNVGISTTSPYGTLTVGQGVQPSGSSPSSKPNIEIWQGSNTVNDAGGIDLRGSSAGAGYGWRITALDSTGVHLVFANRNSSATYTEQMRINSSGNVGIGTNNPTAALDVLSDGLIARFKSSTSTAAYIRFDGTGSSFPYIGLLSGIGTFGNTDASPIRFNTNSQERMRILSDGKVGVGTSSPSYDLEVVGQIGNTNYGSYSNLAMRTANGTLAAPTQITAATLLGLVDFRGLDNASTFRPTSQIRSYSDGAITSTSSPGYLSFFTTPSGSVVAQENVRITSAGYVGIGNTAPITPLHVTGATVTTGVVYKAQPTQTSKSLAVTLTIAELLTGIVQWTGAALTLTLPTGTSIEGGLPATFPTDMSFDVSFINTGSGILTIGANSNATVGLLTVSTSSSGIFRFRKTATNTYTVYRIA